MTAAAYNGHFPGPFASGPQSPLLPPSIMMPVELYGFLISINQLHQLLAYGPRGHEFLELVRSTYASQPTMTTSSVDEGTRPSGPRASGDDSGRAPPPPACRASMDEPASPSNQAPVDTPWWVLKARRRIFRRWRHINPRKRCPFLADMTDDDLRALDNELQRQVQAHLALKSTPSPREETRPVRQLHTPPREALPAHDASPPHADDADDAERPGEASATPPPHVSADAVRPGEASADLLSPNTELRGPLGRDGFELELRPGPGSETSTSTEPASHSQLQTPEMSSMPDTHPRPPRGDSARSHASPDTTNTPTREPSHVSSNTTNAPTGEPSHVSSNTTSISTDLPSKDCDQPLPPSSNHPMGGGLADQNLAVSATVRNECNPAAVSSPREESDREGAPLLRKWICPDCGCVNTEGNLGRLMCTTCNWSGLEPDLHSAWTKYGESAAVTASTSHSTSTPKILPSKGRDRPLPPSSDQPMGSGPADQDLAVAESAGSEPSHLSPSKTNESSTARCFRPRLQGICVSCGRDIPYGVCFKGLLEGGKMCSFCDDPEHAERKYGGDSYPEPKRKRGTHTRFLKNGSVHTRFLDDDSSSASESSIEIF